MFIEATIDYFGTLPSVEVDSKTVGQLCKKAAVKAVNWFDVDYDDPQAAYVLKGHLESLNGDITPARLTILEPLTEKKEAQLLKALRVNSY